MLKINIEQIYFLNLILDKSLLFGNQNEKCKKQNNFTVVKWYKKVTCAQLPQPHYCVIGFYYGFSV